MVSLERRSLLPCQGACKAALPSFGPVLGGRRTVRGADRSSPGTLGSRNRTGSRRTAGYRTCGSRAVAPITRTIAAAWRGHVPRSLADQILQPMFVRIGAGQPRGNLGADRFLGITPRFFCSMPRSNCAKWKNLEHGSPASVRRRFRPWVRRGLCRDLHHIRRAVAGRKLHQAKSVPRQAQPHRLGVDGDRLNGRVVRQIRGIAAMDANGHAVPEYRNRSGRSKTPKHGIQRSLGGVSLDGGDRLNGGRLMARRPFALHRSRTARHAIAAALLFAVPASGAVAQTLVRPRAATTKHGRPPSKAAKSQRPPTSRRAAPVGPGFVNVPGTPMRARQDWRIGVTGRRFARGAEHLIAYRAIVPAIFVRGHGAQERDFEPPRCYPLVPETSASTNSATWAVCG